jgi:glucokinase
MIILAGDVGGTKTELAIFDLAEPNVAKFDMRFVNREYQNFEAMLMHFVQLSNQNIEQVCLAVAGTIINGRCAMPNIAWVLDEQEIKATLAAKKVKLINDLEATAYGVLGLPSDKFVVINEGIANPSGNLALIAAGTGLGEAILFKTNNGNYQVSASEGGHVDYAPHNLLEFELLQYLWDKFGHASWERVVSGMGIATIYEFLTTIKASAEPAQIQSQIMSAADQGAEIFKAAQSGESPLSKQAIEIFIENYGAAAGNLALKALSTGGVYIGGGNAPKLHPYFTNGAFMQSFVDKGRFSDLMKNMPVKLVLEPKTALLGAANYAMKERHS